VESPRRIQQALTESHVHDCCNWGTSGLTTHAFRASFRTSFLRHLGAALLRQRSDHNQLVRVHVGDGRHANARRLDNVDGMDADARTDVAWSGGIFPRHVGRDDGGDDAAILDADALALPSDCREDKPSAPKPANHVGGHRILLRMDSDRYRRLPYWRRAGHD